MQDLPPNINRPVVSRIASREPQLKHRRLFRDGFTTGRLIMDLTTLLIILLILVVLGGGGWYGRGRWY